MYHVFSIVLHFLDSFLTMYVVAVVMKATRNSDSTYNFVKLNNDNSFLTKNVIWKKNPVACLATFLSSHFFTEKKINLSSSSFHK